MQETVAKSSTGMTLRQTSRSVELLTGLSISHQIVHRLSQSVAEKIEGITVESDSLRKTNVLYIEGDGDLDGDLDGKPSEKRTPANKTWLYPRRCQGNWEASRLNPSRLLCLFLL